MALLTSRLFCDRSVRIVEQGGKQTHVRVLPVTAPEISHVAVNSPKGRHAVFFPAFERLFTTVGGYRSAAGYRRKYDVIHRPLARRPQFCRLGCFPSIFRAGPRAADPRRVCIISEKVFDVLLGVIGGGIGLISRRRLCGARVCASGSRRTARLARPAPPRRLIGPSITPRPARPRPLPEPVRLSTLSAGPSVQIASRRVNAATRATEIEAYF